MVGASETLNLLCHLAGKVVGGVGVVPADVLVQHRPQELRPDMEHLQHYK